jgi:hypothetical protein
MKITNESNQPNLKQKMTRATAMSINVGIILNIMIYDGQCKKEIEWG